MNTGKVTLYIAVHNITGKRYFGKTTRYFTEQSLQENYHDLELGDLIHQVGSLHMYERHFNLI